MTPPVRRRALLIGNEKYDDGRFAGLPSARADIWHLRQVLEHRSIGAFLSVRSLLDLTTDEMRYEITEFLDDCGEDELALLYVSGHGTRLIQTGGEFHFITRDTDFEHIAETAVSSGFVNEALEQCAAPQKVVLIDCCRSGGFAVGLRTVDAPRPGRAKSGDGAPLTSRGVYVLSSSRAGEDSYSGAESAEGAAPSLFTAEIVEALRTGRVGKDGTGEVSINDLFEYVNRRMRSHGARQIPVKSAHGVDDRIIIASCPLGAAPRLVPLTRSTPAAHTSTAPPAAPKAALSQPTWSDLLKYYRECVMSDVAEPPLMAVEDRGASYVCVPGSEPFLSGDAGPDQGVPLPPGGAELVQAAVESEAELWAGYPAVVVHGPAGTRDARFAPLLVRAVEVVHEEDEVRLKPYGPVMPHPQLARQRLGAEDAQALAETYRPSWHAGQHDRLAVDVHHLLTQEYELPFVQEPRPDQLEEHIDIATPGDGARNAAVLFVVPRKVSATAKLLKDLSDIEVKAAQISITALEALSPSPAERSEPAPERRPEAVRLVTPLPCNEAQASVMIAAMTRRLTVATGPPGTGKSQLVANLVATAQAAGEKVLVASTNNEAVDEVVRRCEQLAAGSIVRTGSSRHHDKEAAALTTLRTLDEPHSNSATANARLDMTVDALGTVRQTLAHVALTESRLYRAGRAREAHADELGLPVSQLVDLLRSAGPPEALARKVARTSAARFLGDWRRRRLLGRLGIEVPAAGAGPACDSLAVFTETEVSWRAEQARLASSPGDDQLSTALEKAEARVREEAGALLESTVRSAARSGRHLLNELVRARQSSDSDWRVLRQSLAAARAWAVTSLSARRFPPQPALFDLVIIDEASQCAIPHALPLLFRARRALIIGDVMQLPHIVSITPERETRIRRETGLRSDWLEKHRLGFRRHSAFHAAERSAGGSLLLDEHYRCHPDIAELTNRQFYDGGLTVLTDVRDRPSLSGHPAIVWSDVKGRATRPSSDKSWVNRDELDKVLASVRYLLDKLPADTTIGVVTPFRAQAEAVRQRLGPAISRVRVGTVHVFQGGERDVMIFSLVAAEGMRSGTIRWVERQLNLWNVAITRARSHLIVVGDADLWLRQGGIGAALHEAAQSRDKASSFPGSVSGDLSARLFKSLSTLHPEATVELDVTVNGHRLDALLRGADRDTAVLLDPGPPEGTDAARHLRLMLRRRDLLTSGDGEHPAHRLPAWKVFA
ncbi:caspase, EACC1-associated type [Spirillospora sp. CA-294931]|uniref:caspase, EACC1-associated type n=1 Tax=Spirillospora sp. CA-294931 TaxID=3240042 RepID=UPI003D8A8A17